MKYTQMNFEQRYTIECMFKQGQSKKTIALTIGRSESSVYREINRNSKPRGSYNAKYAQMLADERKKEGHVKTHLTISMQKYIRDKLEQEQWSPEQIVGLLYKHLRNAEKKYKKRYGSKDSRGQIPNKVSIEQRPEIVDKKERVGDFESDLIIGKDHKGALLTIVDRYSSFLLIEDVKGKKANMVKKMTINALAPYKKWVHTITNDNGKEFTEHQKIAEKLQCEVYFAHPYSSWERGLNEYTNKLIRQYLPKNKPLDKLEQKYILEIVNKLNNRPRKKLGFKTPKEVFYQYINQNKKIALAT